MSALEQPDGVARVSPVESLIDRVDRALEQLEQLQQPAMAAPATEIAEALVQLYGEALGRIVEQVTELGPPELESALIDDELVSHLLLLHDLHPDDAETRVRHALAHLAEGVGGEPAELMSLSDGVARIQVPAPSGGCGSPGASATEMREYLLEAVPDLAGVEIVDAPVWVPLAIGSGSGTVAGRPA